MISSINQPEIYDLIIIGAGPAGLSAAEAAKRENLRYLVIEKGLIADTVYHYPVGLTVFSTTNELELREGELQPAREKPTREELLTYYVKFVLDEELNLQTEEEVIEVRKSLVDGDFTVKTTRGKYSAQNLLFTIGIMAHLRHLNVPGEDLLKVHHRFVEAFPYVRKEAMVIGGGNSAAEASLFLSEAGAHTTLLIWRSDWENRDPKKGAIKAWVREPLEEQIARGRLKVVLFSNVEEITEFSVRVRMENDELIEIPNTAVFVLIGSDADLRLLRGLGVDTRPEGLTEVPVYDSGTFETNVAGVYVAGHFTRARHIKEAIAVPRRIMPFIAQNLRSLNAR
ncbi:MAG: NAD(P)-binding domain-containing protein [Pyrinomonadaceae bacterium]